MTHRDPISRVLGLALAGGAALAGVQEAQAQIVQDRFLSRVEAFEQGDCATISVEFNTPVQYQSHFPESGGRDLRISVSPFNFNRLLANGVSAESARPPSSDIAGIEQVTYDVGDPSGPTLTLQFDRDVSWDVEADNDVTRIVIHVSAADSNGCQTGSSAAASAAVADAILSVTSMLPDSFDPNGYYAINLASTRGDTLDPALVKQTDAFSSHVAYAYTAQENGATWARLRLGAFATRADAESVLAGLAGDYPDAWIVRLDRKERDFVYRAWTAAKAATGAGATMDVAPVDAEAESMLVQARELLAAGDFPAAVLLANQILGRPESAASPQAQELLGLARERAGQLAHAKAEYEIFLQKYPNDPAAGRVRQRLAVLVTGEAPPAEDIGLRGKSTDDAGSIHSSASGSLSILYQRDESSFVFQDTPVVGSVVDPDKIQENQVNINEILYGADFDLSLGTDRNEALFRFSGVYTDDLRTDRPKDESSISSAYLDLSDRQWNASLRLGRQTRNTGGVFGRFDGAYAGVQLSERLKINGVAGYPVQSSRDIKLASDRPFAGVSVDFALVPDVLDTTFYALGQKYGDLTDRTAVGMEYRYFKGNKSSYGIFDYDTHFAQLNLALLNGAYTFPDKSSVTVAIDYRRSPFLTTQNAIFGQGLTDPNDLRDYYSDDQIYQLAEDRTAYSRSAFISYARPLTEKLQLNLDVIASNVSNTKFTPALLDGMGIELLPAVEAQPSTGTEFYYSGQIVASDMFKQGAIGTFGIRYADLQSAEQTTYQFSGRWPLTNDLRLSPRIRFDTRNGKDGQSSRQNLRASLLSTWKPWRRTNFELEIGGVDSTTDTSTVTTSEQGFFLMAGLRQDF